MIPLYPEGVRLSSVRRRGGMLGEVKIKAKKKKNKKKQKKKKTKSKRIQEIGKREQEKRTGFFPFPATKKIVDA